MENTQFKMNLDRDFEAFWTDTIRLYFNCETDVQRDRNVFTVTDLQSGKKLVVIEVNEDLLNNEKDSDESKATTETTKNQK